MTSIHVLSGGAAQGLVESLRAPFEAATGHRIDGTFGAVGAMRDKLLAGAPADLLILTSALIVRLERDGHLVPDSARIIGGVETAIAVRRRDAAPSIGSADSLRAALLDADEIHLPDPTQATAGIHFAKVLRDLGIADRLAARLRPAPDGRTAMRALAASKSERPIGCTQVTEILATPGLDLVGSLPPSCALSTIYAAAITRHARAPEAAGRLVAMLTAESGRESRGEMGFV
ncbi:MAG: substrate-binding domain-containing protein [Alphaproteobacteria bacterium]|nr:substrate-binding domain-containing protein [Alphaproteobacteria bacterium]MCW5740414.1 substrate-binding domain-containing protein [Alphaproteobacteria bacterium]